MSTNDRISQMNYHQASAQQNGIADAVALRAQYANAPTTLLETFRASRVRVIEALRAEKSEAEKRVAEIALQLEEVEGGLAKAPRAPRTYRTSRPHGTIVSRIVEYVRLHPESSSRDVAKAVGCEDAHVSGAYRTRRLIRSGEAGAYRYSAAS